jgi:hypothetical protein
VEGDPSLLPVPMVSTDLDLATLIPSTLAAINRPNDPHEMNFSKPRDIAGNLAGGIGQDESSCPAGAMPRR